MVIVTEKKLPSVLVDEKEVSVCVMTIYLSLTSAMGRGVGYVVLQLYALGSSKALR